MSSQYRSYTILAIGLFMVSWASIFIRLATNNGSPPLVTAFWRLFLSFIGMVMLAFLFNQTHEFKHIPRFNYKFFIASGFFLALHFASWFLSLDYITIAASVSIVDSAPFFVVIGGFLFLGEKINRIQGLGIFLTILGGIIIGFSNDSLVSIPNFNPFLGNSLALIGAVTVSGYLLIGRSVRQTIGIYAYTSWVYGICTIFLFIIALIFSPQELLASFTFSIEPSNYLFFLLLALGPSIMGHTFYNYSIKEIKAVIVSIVMLGEPVISSILGIIIFGEIPPWLVIIGAIFILFGVAVTITNEEKKTSLPELIN